MIASFDTQVYTEAIVYNAMPIPRKLMTTSMKELPNVVNKFPKCRVSGRYPYAMTTAPSSSACFSVLYPERCS